MTMSTDDERHVELLGQQLRQRRHDALPHLDLPDEAGDPAVGADVQVGVEVGRVALAAGRQSRGLLAGAGRVDREQHEQARSPSA